MMNIYKNLIFDDFFYFESESGDMNAHKKMFLGIHNTLLTNILKFVKNAASIIFRPIKNKYWTLH